MKELHIQELHRIQVRDEKGDPSEAVLEIKYRRIRVLPPINKQKQYPKLTLTVIHAQEREAVAGRHDRNGRRFDSAVIRVVESRGDEPLEHNVIPRRS